METIEDDPWKLAVCVNNNRTRLDLVTERAHRLSVGMLGAKLQNYWYPLGLPLYSQLVQRCISVLSIVPHLAKESPPKDFYWDVPSMLTLIRGVWYQFSAFYYISAENLTADERELRAYCLAVNDICRRLKALRGTGLAQKNYAEAEQVRTERIAALLALPRFQELDQKIKDRLLDGNKDLFHPKNYIGELGWDDANMANIWWDILSNATHSGPMQFFDTAKRWGTEPGETLATDFFHLQHGLVICGKSIERATDCLENLAPEALERIHKSEMQLSWRQRQQSGSAKLSVSTAGRG